MDPNPHTVRSATLGAGWALGVLTIPAFLLIMFRAKLSLGKVFLLSTCVISFALLILSTWAIRHEGAGKHSADLNSGSFTTLAKSLVAHEALWCFANVFLRLAALEGLLPLLFECRGRAAQFSGVGIAVTFIHFVVVIIFGARLCDPTTKLWAKAIEGTCGNEYNYFLGVEVSNLVLDLLLLLLPVFASQQKWFYVAAIGLLVLIPTGIHLHTMKQVDFNDFTYSGSYMALFGLLALEFGIITAGVALLFDH